MARRLGPDFTKLWFASAVSNFGDGMTMAAGPLLPASLTDDPALVAGAVFAQQLPWLLFSLLSGVLVDRFDRRRLAVAANLARGAVVAGLAVAIWTGHVSLPAVYACLFLLGVGGSALGALVGGLPPASSASPRRSGSRAWWWRAWPSSRSGRSRRRPTCTGRPPPRTDPRGRGGSW
ncbi:MFS transporter [Actinosynnema sp. CA-299493]